MTTGHDHSFRLVPVDMYRNIHKGIRAELFAVTSAAGSIDPRDDGDVDALVDHVRAVADLLAMHTEHEDHLDGLLEEHVPDLAARIAEDHGTHGEDMAAIVALAGGLRTAEPDDRRTMSQLLHLDLAAFTGEYLVHQDLEEREVMPALDAAVGPRELGTIHRGIVATIPPAVMARSLAFMLPAMNIDDRAEHLGGMQANAPADVFDRAWGLATSVLEAGDVALLAARLGLQR